MVFWNEEVVEVEGEEGVAFGKEEGKEVGDCGFAGAGAAGEAD